MRKIPKPNLTTKEILLKSIENYRDGDLVERFTKSDNELSQWTNIFEEKVKSNTVHTISKEFCIPKLLSKAEMIKVYDDKLAKETGPGREYYNQLKNSAKNNLCPFCGYRPVDSVDHYLPKSKYPALAISPLNLIPACIGCNKIKGEDFPKTAGEAFLHPYFDNVEDDTWLFSEVIENFPMNIFYKVIPPMSWDEVKQERVVKHFKKFQLGQLYSSYANEELSEILYSFKRIYLSGGAVAVRADIIHSLDSFRYNYRNTWKTALFSALYNSDWFCEEALKHSINDLLG